MQGLEYLSICLYIYISSRTIKQIMHDHATSWMWQTQMTQRLHRLYSDNSYSYSMLQLFSPSAVWFRLFQIVWLGSSEKRGQLSYNTHGIPVATRWPVWLRILFLVNEGDAAMHGSGSEWYSVHSSISLEGQRFLFNVLWLMLLVLFFEICVMMFIYMCSYIWCYL